MIPLIRQEVMLLLGEGDFLFYGIFIVHLIVNNIVHFFANGIVRIVQQICENTFLSVAIYLIYSFSSEAESRKVMLPVRI